MRLRVLNENTTLIDQYYLAEPALSLLLDDGDQRLLFDTGYSEVFLSNAKAMHEDISSPGAIILSHGHNDHSAGLRYWLDEYGREQKQKIALVAHPLAFNPKRDDSLDIGSPLGLQELGRHFALRLSRAPLQLSPRFVFLGEIPRSNPYEAQKPIGETLAESGQPTDTNPESRVMTQSEPYWQPDYLIDDSALVWKGDKGLVIISGCSHSGIVNIVEYAIAVCGDHRITDIIGGFHLLKAPQDRLEFTRDRLAALSPRALHPCHCTDLASTIYLASALPIQEIGVGMELYFH